MPVIQRKTVRQLIKEGAILAVQDGNHGELHPTQEDYVPEGIPFIMASDLGGNDLDLMTCKFLPEGLASTLRKGFALPGDVLLTHKGTLGLTTVVPTLDTPYIMLTPQVTYYRVNSDALRPEYLHYVFSSPKFQKRLLCHVREGTRPYVGITAQLDLEIEYPDINVQSAVVEQLIALDRLIQISLQSIKHFEETARLIYTEWFVQLHFPGHNPSLRANDLPCGWRRDRFDSVITLQRGFDLPADQRIDGDIPIIASTGICGTHSISKVSGPGVVTGRSGTLGKVRLVLEDFWPLNTTLWIKAYRGISPYFAYFLLQGLNLASLNVGASVPSLDRNTVHPLPIIVPDAMTLAKFDEVVIPIFQQIDTLERQIKQLKSARDLLLPRLISGQLRL